MDIKSNNIACDIKKDCKHIFNSLYFYFVEMIDKCF